jgi:outer membrane protein assembly factor BamE
MKIISLLRTGSFLITGLSASVLMSGCQSLQSSDGLSGLITPYKIEVVQGNAVTQELLDQVRIGMSRSQVKDILGSPLLMDPFHIDRWDYVFSIRNAGGPAQLRTLVVTFDGDTLKNVEAPKVPTEREFVASLYPAKSEGKTPVLALTPDQIQALPAPAAVSQSEAARNMASPPRAYPPLESR